MCKDCRRNHHLINLYFEDCISQPCVVDNIGKGVALLEAGTSKKKKFSSQAKMHHSQPVKTPIVNHPQPKKPISEPTKAASQPSKPKAQPSKPTKPTSQPSKPKKPYSQPTKLTHQALKTTSHPIKTPLQSTKLHPQQTKTNNKETTAPHHSKTSSQPAKNPDSDNKKGNTSACRVTRSGRTVREGPIQDEDYDSHDSYESTEDELYKPPKVLGDNLYSSESDSESGKGSQRKQKQAEAKEKHRPPKSRLADKEIDTDDSSYEGFEDEESSESAYKRTYCFNVNPVKGQDLWEKTPHPAPVPPPVKPKPGRPTKKRRRDKEEQPSGSKTKMRRKYNPIWCMYCGEVGHNKRGCAKKNVVDAEEHAKQMQLQLAVVTPGLEGAEPEADSESDSSDSECIPPTQKPLKDQLFGRPAKLLTSSPKHVATESVAVSAEIIKGTSSGTTKRLEKFMTFVPTPGFKAPRKTDDKGVASNFK
ncbi:hypothetical protein Ahy_A09g042556 [Arachis hypogaea]|uniref:CCHC-type domain-containing protein n=1 Tax=Arachis hypogaea TaxID=3818 RepID=A0A445BG75_ARAHY|nr:hypothetical protein Ahy_A09g042556 [Arachis hypogaea]